jgi:DNA-binding HxlR family transcriptional regulator
MSNKVEVELQNEVVLKKVNTNEVIEAKMIRKRIKKEFFYKVWLADLMQILDLLGNKKMLVLEYLLALMDSENRIVATHRKIAEDLGISTKTVSDTISTLQKENVLKKLQNGVYQLNPKVVFFGNDKKQDYLLIEYEKE